jgi:hypothetical protein
MKCQEKKHFFNFFLQFVQKIKKGFFFQKLSKGYQKVVNKLSKKLSKSCQKLPKSCQKVAKSCQKKSCQNNDKIEN